MYYTYTNRGTLQKGNSTRLVIESEVQFTLYDESGTVPFL
jgi:hypothetical protein